jgi:hypothetical protein
MINGDTGETPNCGLFASCYGGEGVVHTRPLDDWEFPHGAVEITRLVRQMAQQRVSPMSEAEMIEVVAAIDAARQSMERGSAPVSLQETIERAETEVAQRPTDVATRALLVEPDITRVDAPVQFERV